VSPLPDWLERHTSQAPAALRARVRDLTHGSDSTTAVPEALANAGRQALEAVVAHPGDRSVALDLLAADALVTLALLAQAHTAPDQLGDFAVSILRAGLPHS
jgi:hypothetical protein